VVGWHFGLMWNGLIGCDPPTGWSQRRSPCRSCCDTGTDSATRSGRQLAISRSTAPSRDNAGVDHD